MSFRFGLIGAGVAGELSASAMRMLREVQVVAVTDVDRSRAEGLAARHRIPTVYPDAERLLAQAPVDAVAILTPHDSHLPQAAAAARAGKHILVEKAFAHTLAAADEMVRVCERHGVVLGCIFQYRFTPAARRLRQAVQTGEIGRIFLATVTVKLRRPIEYYRGAPWRGRKGEAGGGVLMIQAIHTLDLLLWVLGMPRQVFGRTATAVHPVEVEDLAVGILEFPGGAMGILETTTAAVPENPPELEIHGDRGTAATFDSRGFLTFWSSSLDQPGSLPDRWRSQAAEYREPEASSPNQATVEPHAGNIQAFITAVREGRSPLVDGVEARKSLRVIEALYASAASGGWVEVE